MAPPNDLTPQEIAALINPQNHPSRLSLDELDNLTADLSTAELEEVVEIMGLDDIARQLPPIVEKVLLAAKIVAVRPPGYEGNPELDEVVHNFDFDLYERAVHRPDRVSTAPSSSAQAPATPAAAPRVAPSPPSSQEPASVTVPPSTPQRAPPNNYVVRSPARTERVVSWFEAASLAHSTPGATVHKSGNRRPRKPRSAAYAVFYGGQVGAFEDWNRVLASITGHGLAIYGGFQSVQDAQAAIAYARAKGWTADAPSGSTSAQPVPPTPLPLPSSFDPNPLHSAGTHSLWYAVCRGVVPGVYRTWLECSLNTTGIKGNLCNSFATRAEAEEAYSSAFRGGLTRTIPRVVDRE
ncbi:hypothetical protein C8F04DRAFT_1195721 [Mycena alexandri]|uniref:Ribonuclease H1 N-terminal domain-containing protein n=1 Tax=Mycena alexandri TaxID=1745969 RepID=A0AAD6S4U6_9AGAR|nr:hypothetical protein C8F04DRAFT_1195721 [Mycena alexandri]